MRVPDVVRHALCCLAPRLARMAPVRAAERAGGDDLILEGLRESFFGAEVSPLSSWRGPRTALGCSYRSERVTRD